MGITIDIEHADGIYSITCYNQFGCIRQCFVDDDVMAVGLGYILDEVERIFFMELVAA